MRTSLALVLHAHLPFVRHPEHERFHEENWLFEAVVETYLPLLELLQEWRRDEIPARLSISVTPTLCAMLRDPLLQSRCTRHLRELIELAHKEVHRNLFLPEVKRVAEFYLDRFQALQHLWESFNHDVVGQFAAAQERGQIEILASSATHAVLPLLADDPAALRAQLLVGRAEYRASFGRDPAGWWMPECGYSEALNPFLHEAGVQWFLVDTHGIMNARPRPQCGIFAPVLLPSGIAAFGRDPASAQQVWSRHAGYPGDPRYREFYRDIGYDLDWDYVRPYLSTESNRGFTGLKYFRITGGDAKALYDRESALEAAKEHARHFLAARRTQGAQAGAIIGREPILVAPYDAELFGHWWYEGPEFLDALAREAAKSADELQLVTPGDYLRRNPIQQAATPAESSWGEGGYWKMWLNETTQWIYPRLRRAQKVMRELATESQPAGLPQRVLAQAGHELLLAQASDWPFILRTGTNAAYATSRIKQHLENFDRLAQSLHTRNIDESFLAELERRHNLFPNLKASYWAETDPARR